MRLLLAFSKGPAQHQVSDLRAATLQNPVVWVANHYYRFGLPARHCRPLAFALLVGLMVMVMALAEPSRAHAARDLDVGFADYLYGSINVEERNLWIDRTAPPTRASSGSTSTGARSRRAGRPIRATPTIRPTTSRRSTTRSAAAEDHGLDVLLTSFQRPDWAEGERSAHGRDPGAWRPDPRRTATSPTRSRFVTAVALRPVRQARIRELAAGSCRRSGGPAWRCRRSSTSRHGTSRT